jgi:predicted Zn-dependent protease
VLGVVMAAAQVTQPPAFEEPAAFRTGAAPVEGTSHVSARREEISAALVRQLEVLGKMEMAAQDRVRFEEAHGLVKQRLLSAGLEAFERASRGSPGSRPLRAALAVAHFLAGRYEESGTVLLRLAAEAPGEAFLVPLVGEMAGVSETHRAGFEAALRRLARALPKDGAVRYYLAQVLTAGKEAPEEAVALLRESASLDRRDSRPCWELGRIAEKREDAGEAIRWYEETFRRKPDFHAVHYRLGRLYVKAGKQALGEEHLRKFRAAQDRTKE